MVGSDVWAFCLFFAVTYPSHRSALVVSIDRPSPFVPTDAPFRILVQHGHATRSILLRPYCPSELRVGSGGVVGEALWKTCREKDMDASCMDALLNLRDCDHGEEPNSLQDNGSSIQRKLHLE